MSDRHQGLIVGVSDYPNGISKLPAVAADVREIASLLSSPVGTFASNELSIFTDRDAKRATVLGALRSALEGAATTDTIFLYLAGHGHVGPDGLFYFIPHDCDPLRIAATAIPLSTIRDLFDKSASERLLLWLDFCHSGGILSRGLTRTTDAEVAATISRTLQIVQGHGKVIMCACTSDQLAYEAADHGHFTKYLLKGLRGEAANAAGEVTANSLHDYIDREIGSTQQRPMFFGTMTGRMVLMHSRSMNAAETRPIPAEAPVVSDSGSWVMLGSVFFESESVRHAAKGQITLRIPSSGAEDDALLRGLAPEQYRQRKPIPFAHRNDALIVRVENVESESTGAGVTWVITLQPEPQSYGGGFTVDVGLNSHDRSYSADDIAELRARRFLLNDPPPPDEGRRRRGFDPGDSLEMMIVGLNTQYPAKACVFRLLYPGLKDQPQRFMALARLTAIFALKAGQVFEHVTELTLGPIDGGNLHVRCRGKRREVYSNVPATGFEIEGDCPLE